MTAAHWNGKIDWKPIGTSGKFPVMQAIHDDITLELAPAQGGGVNLWVGDDKYGPYEDYPKAQAAALNLPFIKESIMNKKEIEIQILKKLRKQGLLNEDKAKEVIATKKKLKEDSMLNKQMTPSQGATQTAVQRAKQFESPYDGTVLGFVSTWNKSTDGRPVVYYVAPAGMGSVTAYMVCGGILNPDNSIENGSEAFDDWMHNQADAVEIAEKIATDENYDPYEGMND